MIFITILLLLLIIVALLKYFGSKETPNPSQNKVYLVTSIDYVGGMQELLERAMAQIFVDKENVKLKFVGRSSELLIPVSNVLSIEGKNEEEMSKDVTLTRLLVFNIFAFASSLKKTTIKNRKFITIKYLDNNAEEQYVILEHNNAEIIIQKIKLALNDNNTIQNNVSM